MATFHFSPRKNKAHLIQWREWTEEAFHEARMQDKLILLSIGAVWCHWCHVMDEEAYSDETNIDLINERFIPIKVDNDRQPDINRRYNMGGWPTTAILTPDGELLQGGTYIPSKNLTRFLQESDRMWKEERNELQQKLAELYHRHEDEYNQIREQELHEDILLKIRASCLETYDYQYGGFGTEPKFPHPDVLDFLLDEYYRTRSKELAEVIHTTLKNMAGGGMFDSEMGGFFRYSTTQDWSIPHFEKMLEDNSRLLGIYIKAYQLFKEGVYKDTALDVIMFLQDWMIDPATGTFYGSQDADEHYYCLRREEREKLAPPYIDKTIYTNWNALAISSFFHAFGAFEALDCREIALKGLEFLMNHCLNPNEGMVHYYVNGQGHNTGLLEDQVAMIRALLDGYEVTHLKRYLEQAERLLNLIFGRFYDPDEGGFFVDIPAVNSAKPMALLEKPLPINSCMAEMLLRMEVLTGNTRYRDIALRTLRLCADMYGDYGLFAAGFGRALWPVIHGITHVTIVGNFDDPTVRVLFQETQKVYTPHRLVEEFDPILDEESILVRGYDPEHHQAYVCKGTTCYPPVTDPEELSRLLSGGIEQGMEVMEKETMNV